MQASPPPPTPRPGFAADQPNEKEVWVGSIPAGLSEREALQELAAYGVRPLKLVMRTAAHATEPFVPKKK